MFRQGAVATGVVCMMRAGEMESRQFTPVLKLAVMRCLYLHMRTDSKFGGFHSTLLPLVYPALFVNAQQGELSK